MKHFSKISKGLFITLDERQKQMQKKHVQSPDFMAFTSYEPSMMKLYNQDRNIILNEISLVAISNREDVVALGNEVKIIGERESAELFIGSPLKNGVVADFKLSCALFMFLLLRAEALSLFRMFRPHVAICIPIKMTYVEQRAMMEVMRDIGINNYLIIEESYREAARQISERFKIVVEIIPNID